jgi:hypothetical protein
MFLLVTSQKECFVDGFGDIKNGEITINIVLL